MVGFGDYTAYISLSSSFYDDYKFVYEDSRVRYPHKNPFLKKKQCLVFVQNHWQNKYKSPLKNRVFYPIRLHISIQQKRRQKRKNFIKQLRDRL